MSSSDFVQRRSSLSDGKEIKPNTRSLFYVNPMDLDKSGHPAKWKIYYAKSMVIFAALSQVFLLLQLITIFTEKNAAGVSIYAYVFYEVSNILWFLYAWKILLYPNYPIIMSCVVSFILAAVIIVGIVLYGGV